MLRRLSQFLVVGALVLSIGAHWAALQSLAWVGMVISYSHTSTLAEAVQKTFDGQHPCKLCKFVTEGKKSERKQTVIKVETKLNLWLTAETWVFTPPTIFSLPTAFVESVLTRIDSPPVPPPRAA